MAMQNEWRRWGLGFALASLVSVGACADAADGVQDEADALQQVGQGESALDVAAQASGAATQPAWAQREDLGKGNGRDVITIGDSWMSYFITGGIQDALIRKGLKYRNYGVAGTKMLDGAIPRQFDQAVRAGSDIKTVIMTGGGNDVLLENIPDCPRGGPGCKQQLVRVKEALVKLWEKMASAGVKDVVYIGYSEGAGNAAPPEFANAMKNGVGEACLAMTTLNCHVIESTPLVKKRLSGADFLYVHPTPAANDDIATAIVELMAERKIRR